MSTSTTTLNTTPITLGNKLTANVTLQRFTVGVEDPNCETPSVETDYHINFIGCTPWLCVGLIVNDTVYVEKLYVSRGEGYQPIYNDCKRAVYVRVGNGERKFKAAELGPLFTTKNTWTKMLNLTEIQLAVLQSGDEAAISKLINACDDVCSIFDYSYTVQQVL